VNPLGLPAFRLFFAGRCVSLLGDAVTPAALAIAIATTTGSASALALVLGCAMVPRLLLLPIGGVIADRFDARLVALTTDLVRCAAQLFVGLQLICGEPALAHIAAAEAVGGTASAFAMPTQAPLVTGTVSAGPGRQQANALLGTASSTARLAGPAIAALMFATAGAGWAFVLDAVSFLVSAGTLAAIRIERVPVEHRSLRVDLTEGWAEVRSRDWYWTSLLAHGVWNGAAAVLATLGPIVALHELGGEGVWLAVLQAGAIGLLAGSLLAGRARLRRPVLTGNLGLASYALPLTVLAIPGPVPLLVISYGLALAALGFLNPVWETEVQERIPAHALARVTSYDWLVSMAAMPIGYVLAPLAANAWGTAVPLTAAAVLVATACLATAAVPGVRRLTTQDTSPDTSGPSGPSGPSGSSSPSSPSSPSGPSGLSGQEATREPSTLPDCSTTAGD
jgi:MFS family permease